MNSWVVLSVGWTRLELYFFIGQKTPGPKSNFHVGVAWFFQGSVVSSSFAAGFPARKPVKTARNGPIEMKARGFFLIFFSFVGGGLTPVLGQTLLYEDFQGSTVWTTPPSFAMYSPTYHSG